MFTNSLCFVFLLLQLLCQLDHKTSNKQSQLLLSGILFHGYHEVGIFCMLNAVADPISAKALKFSTIELT